MRCPRIAYLCVLRRDLARTIPRVTVDALPPHVQVILRMLWHHATSAETRHLVTLRVPFPRPWADAFAAWLHVSSNGRDGIDLQALADCLTVREYFTH